MRGNDFDSFTMVPFLPSGKEPAIAFGHEEEETFIAVTEPLQG